MHGNQKGPVSFLEFAEDYKRGNLIPACVCWNPSMTDWQTLESQPALCAELGGSGNKSVVASLSKGPPPLKAAPAPVSVPNNRWQELTTPEGRTYYYNSVTNATQWDCPAELTSSASTAPSSSSSSSSSSNGAAQGAAAVNKTELTNALKALHQSVGAAKNPQRAVVEEKLGAPEPVRSATGVAAHETITAVTRAQPEHGWRALKSADGKEYYHNTHTNETTWEKPEILKTADDYERAGEWFWLPDEVDGFVAARKTGTSIAPGFGGPPSMAANAARVTFEDERGKQYVLTQKASQALDEMKWLQLRDLQSDLVMLDVMNKPLILYNLRERFARNDIYTSIGTILISINPYKRLPLYTPAVMEEYIRRGNRKLPPHVFSIADDAFKTLLETRVGQSIVISGESGAGKTECTKQALQYLAEIAGASTSNVEQRILSANPILEAFGNAKTVRNNNSSRFGKYVEIYFDARAQICGATNTNYLLEKIRVVNQASGERNYHAFYQLLRGANATQLKTLRLTSSPSDYYYLSQSGCDTVDDVDDAREHADVDKSMRELGWSAQEINDVYAILAGLLHLGNVHFDATGDRSCAVSLGSAAALANACSLLQLSASAFEKAVTSRVLRVSGQADIDVPLGVEEACAARDALAKFIYERMFDWLVVRINTSIGKGSGAQPSTISILDIFGFEIFERNLFEQLCINFTNEKLQQFFNQHTFKKEEELYRSEGVQFAHVNYIDNQPVLDLIEQRPAGILPIVDEEIKMPKGTDKTFLQKLMNVQGRNTQYLKPYLKDPDMFIVEHYAGTVRYDSKGFLEKNRDQLNEEASTVLAKSSFKFLASLFSDNPVSASSTSAAAASAPTGGRKATLGSKFARQLNELMAALNATEPHYIRCVKPNPHKAPMQFCGQMSLEQLQYAGVFEAVAIRKQGYPFRMTHQEFFLRYKCVAKREQQAGAVWDSRPIENCKALIHEMGLTNQQVQLGITRVLYRAEQHRIMELKRNLAVEEVTTYTQRYCRRALASLLRDRCIKFRPVLKAAVDSREMAKVDAAIAQAAGLGFDIYELKQARRMKFVFEEEKRLRGVFEVLASLDPQEHFATFEEAVASADDIGMKSPDADRIRTAYRAAKAVRDAIDADATAQEKVLDEVEMKAVIARADALPSFSSEAVERLRHLLYKTAEDTFAKLQLKAAVELRDPERIQARTVRLIDIVLDKNGDLFQWSRVPSLIPPSDWAAQKTLVWDRDELAAGMLQWTANGSIHAPLTVLEGKDPKTTKDLSSLVRRLFKNLVGYMGDKKQQQPMTLLVELLGEGVQRPVIRDELYAQIVKQLTNNPNTESTSRGWEVMLCSLHCFPPSPTLENYLQMFLRKNAQAPISRGYINLMHRTKFLGARTVSPSESEVQAWMRDRDSLDCDDYKQRIAKAEERAKAAAEAAANPQPVRPQTGGGRGYGFAFANPAPPPSLGPAPSSSRFGLPAMSSAASSSSTSTSSSSFASTSPALMIASSTTSSSSETPAASLPVGASLGPNRPLRPTRPVPLPPPPAPSAASAPRPTPAAPQGPPDGIEWHYLDTTGAQHGPSTKHQIRSAFKKGELTGESFVWHADLSAWEPLKSVPELNEFCEWSG